MKTIFSGIAVLLMCAAPALAQHHGGGGRGGGFGGGGVRGGGVPGQHFGGGGWGQRPGGGFRDNSISVAWPVVISGKLISSKVISSPVISGKLISGEGYQQPGHQWQAHQQQGHYQWEHGLDRWRQQYPHGFLATSYLLPPGYQGYGYGQSIVYGGSTYVVGDDGYMYQQAMTDQTAVEPLPKVNTLPPVTSNTPPQVQSLLQVTSNVATLGAADRQQAKLADREVRTRDPHERGARADQEVIGRTRELKKDADKAGLCLGEADRSVLTMNSLVTERAAAAKAAAEKAAAEKAVAEKAAAEKKAAAEQSPAEKAPTEKAAAEKAAAEKDVVGGPFGTG